MVSIKDGKNEVCAPLVCEIDGNELEETSDGIYWDSIAYIPSSLLYDDNP